VSVALCIQHVNLISMCRIVLQSASCCAALHFGTLSYKRHEFRRRFIEYKMCVSDFLYSFVWNISHSQKNLDSNCHNSKQTFMTITCLINEEIFIQSGATLYLQLVKVTRFSHYMFRLDMRVILRWFLILR